MSAGNFLKAKRNILSMVCSSYLLCSSSLQGQVCQPTYCPETTCCEDSCSHFFIRGDFLYWKPHLSSLDLDFGSGSIVQSNYENVQITASEEFDIDPHFKWNPGYRIVAGYQFPCSSFEIDALWTHFNSHGTRTIDGVDDIENSGRVKIELDQVDVVLSYNTSYCSFAFKPFLGVRMAKIKEHVEAEVTTDITILPSLVGFEIRNFDDDQHSKVIGPLLGMHGDWDLGCGFGIYGTVAGSILYGYHKVNFQDSDVFTVPTISQTLSVNTKHLHRFNWNLDLALGLRWSTCLCDNFEFGVKVGFEHHEYFNHSSLGVDRGDLSFDGFVGSVIIGF